MVLCGVVTDAVPKNSFTESMKANGVDRVAVTVMAVRTKRIDAAVKTRDGFRFLNIKRVLRLRRRSV